MTTMTRASHYIGGVYAEWFMVHHRANPNNIWALRSADVDVADDNNITIALRERTIKNRGPDPIGDWYRQPRDDYGD